jgi:hypothetical protein
MSRRILITGSRTWTDWNTITEALGEHMSPDDGDVLVHGGAQGADQMAAIVWHSMCGPPFAMRDCIEAWPADWDTHGRRAGIIRNADMVVSNPDLCLAFIRNGSRGASHCLGLAVGADIPAVVYERRDLR